MHVVTHSTKKHVRSLHTVATISIDFFLTYCATKCYEGKVKALSSNEKCY